MNDGFKREERYIVVKLKDMPSEGDEQTLRRFLKSMTIPTRDCVVVESDWPEYEAVWRMIEGRKRKYSPGPWEVDQSGWRSQGNGLGIMSGDDCLAWVGAYNPEQPINENARLIAAAPELLDAAEHCRELLLNYEINRINGDEISEAALAKLNAAISKATA